MIERLERELATLGENGRYRLRVRRRPAGQPDAFIASYQAGELDLTASHPLATAHGLAQLIQGVRSGHLAEFLGERTPRFSLRPLWIASPFLAQLDIPRKTIACEKVAELGYNAIVVDHPDDDWFEATQACSLKLIQRATATSGCALDPLYRSKVEARLNGLLGRSVAPYAILWESGVGLAGYSDHRLAEFKTRTELLAAEARLLEDTIRGRCRLIFYLPVREDFSAEQQAIELPELLDRVGAGTILAFSAVAGDPSDEHKGAHPVWEALRCSPDSSATPLMPIVNAGAVGMGEGLWPVFADEACGFIRRMKRHPFAGAIALTADLPRSGGFLEANLWVVSQLQWDTRSPDALVETWCRAMGFDSSYEFREATYAARRLALGLRRLMQSQGDVSRRMAEELILLWRQLRLVSSGFDKSGHQEFLKEYLRYFLRDSIRMLRHQIHAQRLPMGSLSSEDEAGPSFWTAQADGHQVSLRDRPAMVTQDSAGLAILRANRLLEG